MATRTRRSRILAALSAAVLAAAALAGGCASSAGSPTPTPFVDWIGTVDPNPTMPSWHGVVLTDVNTGKPFKISDFRGKVVLVDLMATWCPSCQGQMSQIRDVIAEYGPDSDFVAVSLDTDAREEADILKKYVTLNNFDWRVAIAPQAVLTFLATNYDPELLNPPLLPMLLIDREGGVWGLPYGAKSAVSLKKTIDKYLNE